MNQKHKITIYDDEIRVLLRAVKHELTELQNLVKVTTNNSLKLTIYDEINSLVEFEKRLVNF